IDGGRRPSVSVDVEPHGPARADDLGLPVRRRRLIRLGRLPVEPIDARTESDRDEMNVVLWPGKIPPCAVKKLGRPKNSRRFRGYDRSANVMSVRPLLPSI